MSPEKLRVHQHPGVEFIYVLQGALDVRVGEQDHALARGDAMYFDSTVPHGYRSRGRGACRAIVVTAA